MNHVLSSVFVTLLCAFNAMSHAQSNDKRLMTDAEYKTFLRQVELALPSWEMSLTKIDPGKDDRISYSLGKRIVEQKNLGLLEVGNIRLYLAKQKIKRTVSGELALSGFLESLFSVFGDEVYMESVAGLTLSNLEEYAPELGNLSGRIGNDLFARVEQLEKGTCP